MFPVAVRTRAASAGILLAVVASAAVAQVSARRTASSDLQQHYDAAEHWQQAGDLDRAAGEYRLFLSQALDELAVGEARAEHRAQASALFEQSLSLDPNSVTATLDYAQAELNAGSFAHAEALSRQVLRMQNLNTHETARAHEILGRTLLRMNQDQEARKELEAAASTEPSFDHSYNLAVACLDLDDAACATRVFAGMQAAYGDTPGIHMDFGRAWGQSDFQPRAEEEFRKAIAENPRQPEAHYSLAATYLQENASRTKDAEAELHKELALSPNDFLTWAALGKLAANEQKYAEAERDLRRAIQLNPKNPDAWLYLGQMDFNRSLWPAAEEALRKAIELTPDPSRNRYQIQKAHYLLGRILMREGKQKEAAAEMKVAQSFLENNLVQDRSKLTGMLGTPEPAGKNADSALALGNASHDASSAHAEDIRKAAAFRKEITQPVADGYNNLGDIFALKNEYATAASFFRQAAAWNPAMEGLDLNWGRAAFSASQYGDAIAPLTRYVRDHPGEQNIRAFLGISQYMVKDYRGCVKTLQAAGAEVRSVPQVAFVYADSLVKIGQSRTGMDLLTALEQRDPGIPDVHRALGEAYLDTAEKKRAIEELRKSLQLNPQDERAREELNRALGLAQKPQSAAAAQTTDSAAPQKP